MLRRRTRHLGTVTGRVALAGALVSTALAVLPQPVAAAADTPVAGSYVPVAPTRLLDTRSGTGAAKAPVGAGKTVSLAVRASGSPVPAIASAVVLNVTVARPAKAGYVTVYGSGARPTVSNLNFVAGQTVPNLVVSKLDSAGKVHLFNGASGAVDLVADVSGYVVQGTPSAPGAFGSVTPKRLLDTRSTATPKGSVAAGHTASLVLGEPGTQVPENVSAVLLNVTVVHPAKGGYVTVFGAGTRPTASNLNFVAGQTVPNLVVAPVDKAGVVHFYNGSTGSLDLLADISGYVLSGAPAAAGTLGVVAPTRLLDTRKGAAGSVGAGATVPLDVHGTGSPVPAGATAVVLNVTVTRPSKAGYVTVYGPGERPTVSNLNFAAGQTVPNLVVAPVDAAGKVHLYNGSPGSIDLVADVSAYVQGAPVGAGAPVTGLSAPDSTDTTVKLTWTNPAGAPLESHIVRRAVGSTPPATPTSGTAGTTVPGAATAFVDSGLDPDTTYSYAVFAVHDGGQTSSPAATDATTLAPPRITGRVTSAATGAPVAGVEVLVYGHDDTSPATADRGTATTGSDGTYSLDVTGPDVGYGVCFDPSGVIGAGTGFQRQCGGTPWDGTDLPSGLATFAVAGGDTRSGVDASLLAGGSIAGVAAPGMEARVYIQHYRAPDPPVARTTVAADGSYRFDGLTPIDDGYHVCFTNGSSSKGYVPVCYPDATWDGNDEIPNYTTPVPVTAGHVSSDIDPTLELGATVQGKVVAKTSGLPVAGAEITLGGREDDGTLSTTSGADGSWAIRGARPDTYDVCAAGAHATSGDVDSGFGRSCADAVTVSGTSTSTVPDLALDALGGVRGRVLSADGRQPLARASVLAEVDPYRPFDGPLTRTDSDGYYTLTGLPAADHVTVLFGGSGIHGGPSMTGYLDSSATTTVTTGTFATLDATLDSAAGLSGTVTDRISGHPVAGVAVGTWTHSTNGYTGASDTRTDADGNWVITRLATTLSDVEVCFAISTTTSEAPTGYEGTCYDGRDGYTGRGPTAGADPVPITPGQVAGSIDVSLPRGGAVSGTVTVGSRPAAGEPVFLYYPDGDFDYGGETDADGHYVVTGRAVEQPMVVCIGSTYLHPDEQPKCWQHVAWDDRFGVRLPAGVTPLTLESGRVTTGIDEDLSG